MPSRVNVKSGGTTPTGTINITENRQYNVTDYATADVQVVDDRVDKILNGTITSISSNVTSLKVYALAGCPQLTSIDFPELITAENYAFQDTGITRAYFPKLKLAQNKGQFLFYYAQITFAHFPVTEEIPSSTLRNCRKLVTAVFDNATSIRTGVFMDSILFKNLVLPQRATMGDVNCFSGNPFRNGTGGTVYTNYDNVSWYESATNWSALESTTFTSIQENLITLQSLSVDITDYYEIVTELPTTDISTTKVYLIETSTTGTYEQHYYNGTSWSTNLPDITL